MSMSVFWAALAGAAIVAELLTGTLYLLVLGIAATTACLLAFWTGASFASQLALFSVLCVPGILGLHKCKKKEGPTVLASDIGATVEVLAALANGVYRVRHSGTEWDAVLVDGDGVTEVPKWLTVVGTQGNLLKCKPVAPK